jgi:hypothetical protein
MAETILNLRFTSFIHRIQSLKLIPVVAQSYLGYVIHIKKKFVGIHPTTIQFGLNHVCSF